MDIICCRVCLAEDDGQHLSLFGSSGELSEFGILYETSMDLKIDFNSSEYYPQFLCRTCEQQIRVFLQMKMKAHATMRKLEMEMEQYGDFITEEPSNDETSTDENPCQLPDKVSNVEIVKECPNNNVPSKVYADIYQEFVSETTQRTLRTEPTSVVSNNDTEFDDNSAFYITEEMYKQLKQEQRLDAEFVIDDDDEGTHAIAIEKASDLQLQHQRKTNIDIAKNEIQLVCFTCTKRFADRAEMKQHRKTHHDNKYPCSKCSKILQSADALRVHLRLHNGKGLFNCEICSKTFNQKVHYKYHMNRHNNIRQFDCEFCGKSYLSKSDLRTHIRSHTGERPYSCELCGKNFIILQHLKTHMYCHFKKSFACDKCKQTFTSPITLHQHRIAVHDLQPRRFRCVLCDKRFRRKNHLLTHLHVHENTTVDAIPSQSKIKNLEHKTTGPESLLPYDESQPDIIEEIVIDDVEYESNIIEPEMND